jgi:UDP-N-acetylglucosamine:LPS N-acetylglucosamine transferase
MPAVRWHLVGLSAESWVEDPWPYLCAADVVVSAAGESSIADIAAAARPAIVISQQRPFNEQTTTAAVLADAGLAVIHSQWPLPAEWPDLLRRARRIDARRWECWRTNGAARRAASAIEAVAARGNAASVAP